MLVLLIIFMISAPLLTAGVPVELPKTEAGVDQQRPDQPRPSPSAPTGPIFVQAVETPFADLARA